MDTPRSQRPTRARWLRWLLAGALAIAVALVVGVMRTRDVRAASVPRATTWTEKVRHGALRRQIPMRGTFVSERVNWLSATSEARVASISVRAGAVVRADTVILVLENADLELAALEAERQAASAESTLLELDVDTNAEGALHAANLARLKTDAEETSRRAIAARALATAGLMPRLDQQSAEAKAAGASEQVSREETVRVVLESGRDRQLAARRTEMSRLRAIAAFRRRQLDALKVRAGLDGVVQEISLEAGMWVPRGTSLARIAEPGHLKVKARVAEGEAREVLAGLPVRFEGASGELRGRVQRIDPTVTRGEVELDVSVEGEPPPGARPDQAVTGYVEVEQLENVTFVARPPGVRDHSTVSVFRVGTDPRYVERQRVEFGKGSAGQIQVVAGLSAGDEIVVSDTSTWPTENRIALE